MTGLAIAVVLLALAVIVLGVRGIRRRSFTRHTDRALRIAAADQHPAGKHHD